MLSWLKFMKLGAALKERRKVEEAFAAVVDLGRIGNAKAVDLLIEALERRDPVTRSAARELGRIGDPRAAGPLAGLLDCSEVSQSAAEALVKLGPPSVEPLLAALKQDSVAARVIAAGCLGALGEGRAVPALIEILSHDNAYEARVAAADALGVLKDRRAVWVLVGTLKLRGETSPERQRALEELQQAAGRALTRMGELLPGQDVSGASGGVDALVDQLEQGLSSGETHPKLIGDPSLLSEGELVGVMKELVAASEEISWAKLENREPMLAEYFRTYDLRSRAAEAVGRELHRRGGRVMLDRALSEHLGQNASVTNWWASLG